jgi:hypothetical protein
MVMKRNEKAKPSRKSLSPKKKIDYKISLYDYHPNHDLHMCRIVSVRNMNTVAELAKDAKYICFICGRAAKKKEHLCEPVAI